MWLLNFSQIIKLSNTCTTNNLIYLKLKKKIDNYAVIKFLSPACADFFSTKYVIQPKLGSKCAYWVCMLTIGRGIY